MKYKILEGWASERFGSSDLVLFVSSVLCSILGHKWRDAMYVTNETESKVCEQCYRCWETKNYDKTVVKRIASDLQETD